MTFLALALTSLLAAQAVTPSSTVWSSTSGAPLPRLDPRCTAELCPFYREAALRFDAKLTSCQAGRGACDVQVAGAAPAVPTSGVSSVLTAVVVMIAIAGGFAAGFGIARL